MRKNMLKNEATRTWYGVLLAWALVAAVPAAAAAVTISFHPHYDQVQRGKKIDIDIVASDLGGATIGGFDLDVAYNAWKITIVDAEFGLSLGDPAAFEALVQTQFSTGLATLQEVSLLAPADLAALQEKKKLVLGTITIKGLKLGLADLDLSGLVSDAFGNPLDVTFLDGKVEVVPEPTAALLFLLGGVTISAVRRSRA
jgi:hypothetical protein